MHEKKHPRLVEVRWVDSAFHRGWSDAADRRRVMTVAKCRTVGYLLERSAKAVKLAMSTADDASQLGDGITIPGRAVKRIRYLR